MTVVPSGVPSGESEQVFRSAIGWPIWVIMVTPGLVAFSMILLLVGSPIYPALVTTLLVVALALLALHLWNVAGTTYRIRNGILTVSTLFRRKRIALPDITAVKRYWSHSVGFRENFGLRSNGILITHANSRIFVSPKDEQNFLAALGRRIDK